MKAYSEAQLFSVEDAAKVLGGISPWTIRKHIQYGNLKVTRIGRRVFLDSEELERIRMDGLPSLGHPRKPESVPVPPAVGSGVLATSG